MRSCILSTPTSRRSLLKPQMGGDRRMQTTCAMHSVVVGGSWRQASERRLRRPSQMKRKMMSHFSEDQIRCDQSNETRRSSIRQSAGAALPLVTNLHGRGDVTSHDGCRSMIGC